MLYIFLFFFANLLLLSFDHRFFEHALHLDSSFQSSCEQAVDSIMLFFLFLLFVELKNMMMSEEDLDFILKQGGDDYIVGHRAEGLSSLNKRPRSQFDTLLKPAQRPFGFRFRFASAVLCLC